MKFLATNPAALKHAFDTREVSLARGLRHFLWDTYANRLSTALDSVREITGSAD